MTAPFITDQSWAESQAGQPGPVGRIGQILSIVNGTGADQQTDSWDAVPTAQPASVAPTAGQTPTGLDSTLQQHLDALFAAAPGNVGISSGFRTRDQQQALYDKYKAGTGNLAAVPGTSRHESGLAADLHYASPAVQQWVHEHAAEYGLTFPINGEPWHVELAGGRSGASTAALTPASTAAGGMVSGDFHDRMAQIMGIVNGTGAAPQSAQWNDMTAAPAPDAGMTDALAPAGHLGVGSTAAGEGEKAAYQSYAQKRLADYGWTEAEMPYLIDLWNRESGWDPNAQNKTSTAYGIPQFLDSTWGGYGKKTSDPHAQIDAGLAYIAARYGSPRKALAFWESRQPINGKDVGNWY